MYQNLIFLSFTICDMFVGMKTRTARHAKSFYPTV